jgi:Toprim-like/MCM P-loop domain
VAPPKPQDLLAPYIAGDYTRENGDVDAHCPSPEHPGGEDLRRSAVLNFDKGVWYCNAEGIGGSLDDLIERRGEWVPPPNGAAVLNGHSSTKRERVPEEMPSEGAVEGWRAALASSPVLLDDLKATRGLWTKTVDHFELGWDAAKRAYTIPVRDSAGTLVNVRRYQLRPPAGKRKVWGVTGHNKPELYPWSALNKARKHDEPIIICEGEMDALITNQYGFRAVTRTSSARAWRAEWAKHFKGLVVYVCHDMDTAGQAANRKVARSLARSGVEVRVVRLPYAVTTKHGKDLTDWWLEHDMDREAFRRMLEDAQPFDETQPEPEEVGPDSASITDAFDSGRVGHPLGLTVTIKGRSEPGFSVPRSVQYRCTQDKGNVCAICPMMAEEGEMDRTIKASDPTILKFIDATDQQARTVLRESARIPKCEKLSIKVVGHQAVETLYARPSVDHNAGTDSASYTNLRMRSVGRHDTDTNQTVRVVGALHPNPKTHANEFLVWDVSKLETSVDRFDMDRETYELLSQFQTKRPLRMLRAVAEDLAAHVTHITGRVELHAAMDLVFHSVVGFAFDGKDLARGWLELLVVGDTRTGKSEVATRLARHYNAGEVVSCESASLAGILGGLQQYGGKEWSVTWGAVPVNDRRLVVLDEVSGLSPEHISQLSSVRSSGIAELTKIQQERTHARTRLIWLGNPRDGGRMEEHPDGVMAIRPLIGNPEDVARFDLAMTVSSEDVEAATINARATAGQPRFTQEALRALVRWVWSRKPENVRWEPEAVDRVYALALDLGRRYVEDPPLVQAANVREKVARIAVALAARTFSTDDRGEDIIVTARHAEDAVKFLERLYNMPRFGYGERSAEFLRNRAQADRPENINAARLLLKNNPGLDSFLRTQGKFRRQDLEEVLNIEREDANAIISTLMQLKMVYKDKNDVRLTSTLNRLLREARK